MPCPYKEFICRTQDLNWYQLRKLIDNKTKKPVTQQKTEQ
ncbi:hypothetical protein FDUTEX481_01312 [Tolypothrix sp. PCC 7601]|nr:hypothetical protein FDUTEX481_01312 [Tolypothrix sp. PCC 7601]